MQDNSLTAHKSPARATKIADQLSQMYVPAAPVTEIVAVQEFIWTENIFQVFIFPVAAQPSDWRSFSIGKTVTIWV